MSGDGLRKLRRSPVPVGNDGWRRWYTNPQGYVVRQRAIGDGKYERQYQHRFVMEQKLGRPLLPDETVHHINGVRDDNRPENLELWSKSQPPGQRMSDKTKWAIEWLERHAPDRIA